MVRELTKEESDFLHSIYSSEEYFEEWISSLENEIATNSLFIDSIFKN